MLLAAGIGPVGLPEAVVILLVVVLIFGVGKVSEVGGALGKSVREFRRATREDDDAEPQRPAVANANSSAPAASSAPTSASRFCSNCGAQLNAGSRFCSECGAPVRAAVN